MGTSEQSLASTTFNTKKQPNHHQSILTVATCNLNQWALDFTGNLKRIYDSCVEAKRQNATYRLGPELELCGYGCEDHFFETDTYMHCWESLAELFELGVTDDMFCDFGMPVLHGSIRYNCRILCMNRKVILIRPKTAMADGGNYRESRYFTAYRQNDSNNNGKGENQQILLPRHLFEAKFGQIYAPFGTQYVQCADGTTIGCESCEELWTPQSTHINMALQGVCIIGNGSGSHHELRKLNTRVELMMSATRKCGGIYLYANQRGCDGGRLYYDGCAMILCNGNILAQANQFDLCDVQVITATVDLDDVRSYRASIPSLGIQAATISQNYVLDENIFVLSEHGKEGVPTIPLKEPKYHKPEEECCLGPACWLWDYLRRSGASGYLLPLSGGADSSATAAIVGSMCVLLTDHAQSFPNSDVANELRRVCRKNEDHSWVPPSAKDLANIIFHTSFMGTENSSDETKHRAAELANQIGSFHQSFTIDIVIRALLKLFDTTTGKQPKFVSNGGSNVEDLALQNIQARLRMVIAYLLAQLLPWVRGRPGFLLVLGSANVDEGLRGYMTKYDCSSADVNPIGGISKQDLKNMLLWANETYGWTILKDVVEAKPTAELRPIINDTKTEHTQTDEEDMGMTYEELGIFGRLRKIGRCGPVSMFRKLCVTWSHLSPETVGEKVKRFFYYYSVNRHKMVTITPAYHAEAYSPDDNRFDLRQFLYNPKWDRQFATIDEIIKKKE